jgi:Flp pilus assembly protein TadB
VGVTGLIIAGLAIGAGAWMLLGGSNRHRAAARDWVSQVGSRRMAADADQRRLVEAIAAWTENLRDAVTASSGLEQAILATGSHCPRALDDHVARLVSTLRYGDLEASLREFADSVDHPTCDFVVAALVTASKSAARDLAPLLGHLSECARAECALHLRVWVSRARTRTSVRIVIGSVVAFVGGLVVFNPSYLAPFATPTGLLMLSVCGGCFAVSLNWMLRMSRVAAPARFLRVRTLAS